MKTTTEDVKKITLSASEMDNAIATLMSKKKKRRKPLSLSSVLDNNSSEGNLGDHDGSSSNSASRGSDAEAEAAGDKNLRNALSDLIPGYTAPFTLDSSSLDKYKRNGTSTTTITTTTSKNRNRIRSRSSNETQLQSAAAETNISQINIKPTGYYESKNFKMSKKDPFIQARKELNAGSKWFGFEASEPSSSLQADIDIIRNRTYLDPKKFYKKSDMGKKGEQRRLVQLGTVIEGAMESVYSNRLSKKQRKNNLLEEVMGETFQSKDDYVKRKYTDMQREKTLLAAKRKKKRGRS